MPTYQYECGACDHAFEILQSMMDKRLKKCPQCGEHKLHRLIGAGSGIIFKGSGFYETDYKKRDAPISKAGASKEPSDTSSKPEVGKSVSSGKQKEEAKQAETA
jgi:putative FmdB family regulatory protein